MERKFTRYNNSTASLFGPVTSKPASSAYRNDQPPPSETIPGKPSDSRETIKRPVWTPATSWSDDYNPCSKFESK